MIWYHADTHRPYAPGSCANGAPTFTEMMCGRCMEVQKIKPMFDQMVCSVCRLPLLIRG